MSWFGGIFFGEYDVDSAASAPAPPPVVAASEPKPAPPSDVPTGDGRWVRMPPTYIPIGIEYEPVFLHGKVIVGTRVDVIAEAIVTRDVIVSADINFAPMVARARGHVTVNVHAHMHAMWTPPDLHADCAVTIPPVTCECSVALNAQAQHDHSIGRVILGEPHAYFDKLRRRAEEEAFVLDFDD